MSLNVSDSKHLKRISSISLVVISLMLLFLVYNNYKRQYTIIINTFLILESEIIKEASQMANLWLDKRIKDEGVTIEDIEQEILKNFIEPISLLNSGDAWIYNKDYVIFDKSGDFPDYYRGKSMRQIFEIQSRYGASHYEELTIGVENATEGQGWYIWLPEKGKEWVSWTSFRFHEQTWTLGLSTPEKDILAYADIKSFLVKQIVYALILIILLSIITRQIFSFQSKQEKLISELNQANEDLKNVDVMKNNLIANISHDFKNPLTIIYNLAELNLVNSGGNAPQNILDDLNVIYETSHRFISKINSIIDLVKLDSRGLDLKIQRIRPVEFLSEIASYYSNSLKRANIQVAFRSDADEYDFFYTDPEKLEDIINNIIFNAIKFIQHEHGIINIDLLENDESIEIKIQDNGIGIEKEYLEKIFTRFERIEDLGKGRPKGSGIGLAYSRQLAVLLGGSIRAESDGRDKGASFFIVLDRNKFNEGDRSLGNVNSEYVPNRAYVDTYNTEENKPKVSIVRTNRQFEFDPFKGIILIAEDEPAIRNVIVRYLENSGYMNFITVENGEIALEMAKIYHPDLVITDYMMPEMNGDEFCRVMFADPFFEFIPIIFISAVSDRNLILEQKTKGAVDFITKPIRKEELLISVNSNLKKYMDFTQASSIDELSKMLNRRAFFKNFENLILNPSTSDLSVILLDLDYFKEINDTYGHKAEILFYLRSV